MYNSMNSMINPWHIEKPLSKIKILSTTSLQEDKSVAYELVSRIPQLLSRVVHRVEELKNAALRELQVGAATELDIPLRHPHHSLRTGGKLRVAYPESERPRH